MRSAVPSNTIIIAPDDHTSTMWLTYFDPQAAVDMVIAHIETLPSSSHERHTMRAYLASLADFCVFCGAQVAYHSNENYSFNFDRMNMPTKPLLLKYIASCKKRGLTAATVTRYLAAVRHFLRALNEQPIIPHSSADFVFVTEAYRQFRMAAEAKNPTADYTSNRPALEQYGTRLTLDQVNMVFESLTPIMNTIIGKRDLAILYLGITSGLRAAEIVRLTLNNITSIKDYYEVRVRGKRSNHDPIGIDPTAYALMMAYVEAWNSHIETDNTRFITSNIPIFQPLLRGDHIPSLGLREYAPAGGMSARAVLKVVDRRTYDALGFAITAHDMRRTCAFLMRSQGFEWDEIRAQLRHRSIGTTEKYVGREQDLSKGLLSKRANFTLPHKE